MFGFQAKSLHADNGHDDSEVEEDQSHEPGIDKLQIRRLWDALARLREESSEDEQGREGDHDAVLRRRAGVGKRCREGC